MSNHCLTIKEENVMTQFTREANKHAAPQKEVVATYKCPITA